TETESEPSACEGPAPETGQIHKMTTGMTERYDEIVIEDLNVRGMVKNHKLARSICDAGFHQIRRMLEYKCAQKGRKLTVTG
ncbi:IS200/IS605 family accessory protein TnpB-related protein, partial [Faecalibaculum rodentium]|uniref:IS200/IS605 family accessory protein TnpB-related protein n=2 Tax=Faecalibaculum rodentium TaxID=1702221 RepID=UPI00261A0721